MTTSFINGVNINSTACDSITLNPLKGVAYVQFNDGSFYRYANVSRRAIIKFLIDDARSLGKFINNVLFQQRVEVVNCG